ncbi:MAG: PQQ-dependent sugar dehydrogenase [Chloroflexi bacterium]|nr:PQQ-dependent sugar dehydrogenase [Chloroflexota bacterium]
MRARTAIVAPAVAFLLLLFLGTACGGGENPFGVKSEVVTQADHADAMVVAPDGRLLFAEQLTGKIRIVTPDGKLLDQPFAQVEVALYVEWGLTGLALDPDFASNHFVYAFLTQPVSPDPPPIGRPVIVRFTDQNNQGVDPKVLVGDLRETVPEHPGFNANGKIHFGPDGFLYASLGDYDTNELVQDLSTPMGKLLRINKEDGSAAPGNPLAANPSADQRIFAYGFREPFDFAFHPQTGQLYGTDNTPNTCEALNIVQPGANYGWPNVGPFPFSDCLVGREVKPLYHFAKGGMNPGDFLSLVEVTSIAFASGSKYPLIGDSLLVCEKVTKLLRRVTLAGQNFDQVTADDAVVKDCQLAIAVAPDGTVYYSNETEIRRLVPTAAKPVP